MWSRPHKWSMEISQLKPELQGIIRENRFHFDGEPVPSLGADVEIVATMNKSRMLSILVIDRACNQSCRAHYLL